MLTFRFSYIVSMYTVVDQNEFRVRQKMKLNVIDSGREFELFVVQYLYTVIINFQTKLKRKQEGYTSLLKKLRNVLFFSNT